MSDNFESISYLSPKEIEIYLRRLGEENKLFERLLDFIDRGVCVINSKLNIEYANKFFLTMQFAKRDADVKNIRDFIQNEDIVLGILESVKKRIVFDSQFSTKEGDEIRIFSIHLFPFSQEKTVCVLSDITQHRKEIYEMHRLEALAAFSSIAPLIAHDINNPLSSISIQMDLMRRNVEKRDSDFLYEHIDIVKSEIERIKKLVQGFLNLSKPVGIKPLLNSPKDLMDSLISFIEPTLKSENIKLELSIQKSLPYLEFDFDMLHNALLNIIKNAIESMTESDEKTLTINVERKFNLLVISISDTGCGMDDNTLSNIFKPYFTTKKTGTGLGLSNVYSIVKMHGGDVEAKQLQKGSQFIISLPLGIEDRIGIPDNYSSLSSSSSPR